MPPRPIPSTPAACFEAVRDHVLLPYASSIEAADGRMAQRLSGEALELAARAVPDEWLGPDGREVYVAYLRRRLEEPRGFVEEAERARG